MSGTSKSRSLNSSKKITSKSQTVKGGFFKQEDIDESLSSCDWDLLVGDNVYKPQREHPNRVKFGNEPLNLICAWAYCDDEFDNYNTFITHLQSHFDEIEPMDGDDRCYWSKCTFVAASRENLRHHIFYHGYHEKLKSLGSNVVERLKLPACTCPDTFTFPTAPNGYTCEWDDCVFHCMTFYEFCCHLDSHMWNYTKPKNGTFQCFWKGCKFKDNFRLCKLQMHCRVHTQERSLACPTCGKTFSTRLKFCDHRTRQTPQHLQSYMCSTCNKYFASERLLKDHMRLHVNQYKCSMCEMTCPKPSILATHIRYKHLKEKPFKCHLCDYRAVRAFNLEAHLKTHDKKMRFECDQCDFKCRSDYGLKKHQYASHKKGTNNIYECHNCKKRYPRGGLLTIHLMKVHSYSWPSGHNKFRYKMDSDRIFRLQTVRYETFDVTAQILKGIEKPDQSTGGDAAAVNYTLRRRTKPQDRIEQFEVHAKSDVNEDNTVNVTENVNCNDNSVPNENVSTSSKPVLITIEDVDVNGTVLKSYVIKSEEITCENIKTIEQYITEQPDLSTILNSDVSI